MKMFYEKPKLETLIFNEFDVIHTSYKVGSSGDGGIYDFGNLPSEE
jgi:hypothetical protein